MPKIITVGELLIDLISTEYATDFRGADRYQRLAGGSPANLAMNLARLGQDVGLIATVGNDDAGTLLTETVRETGADVTHLARVAEPTTLILVTKSQAVSNFEPYRLADRHISAAQLDRDYLASAGILHTTAFALSQEPARGNIIRAFTDAAATTDVVLSTDFNYADKIWGGDRTAGLSALRNLAAAGALVKVSDVDYERLFGEPATDHAAAAKRILGFGARLVCLTLGGEGCYVATADEAFHLPARPVEVRDTTGAGDAFWAGFLAAFANGHPAGTCARAGRSLAEQKLTVVGPVLRRQTVADLIAFSR